MPKSDINEHFEGERPEWTTRKHALLGRYFIPAAMKMKSINGNVVMIDGFAGPNMYGGEVKGSTVIMLEAARKVIAQGAKATVYACEADAERFHSLSENLRNEISSGLLHVYHSTHASAVADIQKSVGNAAIVFLDPQTAAEMTLAGDIQPWATRRSTDVLGVFMGGDACRVCASLLATNPSSQTMRASLGKDWHLASTEDAAYKVFMNSLRGLKRFGGLYRLRKQEPKRSAYGIFGLSDSAHGLWLLSEAVAKDWGLLKDFDASKTGPSLFSDLDAQEEDHRALRALATILQRIVTANPELRGSDLGIEALRLRAGELFGKYTAADYTRASKAIIASEQKGNNHA